MSTPTRRPDRLLAGSRRPSSLGTPVPGTVSLAMGEPDGGSPAPVVEAAIAALRRGRTTYSPLTGEPALREAVAAHLGGGLTGGNVVLTHGASAGLAAAVLALVEPAERVVLPEPTYSLYADHVAMAGGVVRWVPGDAGGRLDLAALRAALPGARLVVVCNPGNPTGRVCPGPDLTALVEAAAAAGAWVLVDEAYRDLVYDGVTFTSAVSLMAAHENVLCCGTFSKSYAMTGWRLGWVVAPAALADAINLVHRSVNGALNMFVQDAGLAALALGPPYLRPVLAQFQRRRDLVVEALAGLDGVQLAAPEGAFYAFPRIAGCADSRALVARLAAAGVLVRAGWEFGPSGEGHLRLSFATDLASLQTGLDRLRAGLARG